MITVERAALDCAKVINHAPRVVGITAFASAIVSTLVLFLVHRQFNNATVNMDNAYDALRRLESARDNAKTLVANLTAENKAIKAQLLQLQQGPATSAKRGGPGSHFCDQAGSSEKTVCVMDIGAMNGHAAVKYLKQGARVVALEASPPLASTMNSNYSPEVLDGKLLVLGLAVAKEAARSTLFSTHSNPTWSSLDYRLGCRYTNGTLATPGFAAEVALSSRCAKHHVPTTSCQALIDRLGTPTYLRIDVESENWTCLESLQALVSSHHSMPKFVSVAVVHKGYVDLLHRLGYTKFKAVNLKGERGADWGDAAVGSDGLPAWKSTKEILAQIEPGLPPKSPDGGPAWYAIHASRD